MYYAGNAFQTIAADLFTLTGLLADWLDEAADVGFVYAFAASFCANVVKSCVLVASRLKVVDCIQG